MFVKLESGELVFRVSEGAEFVTRYETAAWYTRMQAEAGDYPVKMFKDAGCRWETTDLAGAYWVLVTIPGTVIEDYFPSLFGGVVMTPYDKHQNYGEPTSHGLQVYSYLVMDALARRAEAQEDEQIVPEWNDERGMDDQEQDSILAEQESNYLAGLGVKM